MGCNIEACRRWGYTVLYKEAVIVGMLYACSQWCLFRVLSTSEVSGYFSHTETYPKPASIRLDESQSIPVRRPNSWLRSSFVTYCVGQQLQSGLPSSNQWHSIANACLIDYKSMVFGALERPRNQDTTRGTICITKVANSTLQLYFRLIVQPRGGL